MSDRDRIVRAVMRARARLESVRLSKAAARGALWGGGAGLALLLAGKTSLALAVPPWAPWSLLLAGALAAAVAALLKRRIDPVAAALFLDHRLGTEQRVVTVLTRPGGPFVDRVTRELVGLRFRPRYPFPREAGVVPAALFLLFAAGLLPQAGRGAEAAPVGGEMVWTTTAAAKGATTEVVDVTAALKKLARGETPDAADASKLMEAIERRIHRPEERSAARKALGGAVAGDEKAAADLVSALRGEASGAAGGVAGDAYPEARGFLLEYRRALAGEDGR